MARRDELADLVREWSTSGDEQLLEEIDALLDDGETTGKTMYRGYSVRSGAPFQDGRGVGDTVRFSRPYSWSSARYVADMFSTINEDGGRPVILVLASGAHLADISGMSSMGSEEEWMSRAGRRYRITGWEDDGDWCDPIVVSLEEA